MTWTRTPIFYTDHQLELGLGHQHSGQMVLDMAIAKFSKSDD